MDILQLTPKKTHKEEYVKLRKEMKDLEVKRELLQSQMLQVESAICLEDYNSAKKVKREAPSAIKQTQIKIDFFCKPNPTKICENIIHNIVQSAWKVIYPSAQSSIIEENNDAPKAIKVKVGYSKELKRDLKNYMKDHSIYQTYLYCNRRVPRSTLYDWFMELKINKNAKTTQSKQGRTTPFLILEEELFEWFLKARARKIIMTQSSLVIKALKICKEILMDENLVLTPDKKEAYTKFGASNGWIDRFKTRYRLSSRFITTKCTKSVTEMETSLKAYFADLNNTLDTQKPAVIYNMDETSVFFELSRNHTFELKGKKIVGKFSSGKEKVRVTLVITASSTGYLLPPFLIFKVSKPRNKSYKDIPAKEEVIFRDEETKRLVGQSQLIACQTFSGWNNKRVMEKFYLPFYQRNTSRDSLLIFDNHGSHICDDTVKVLKTNNIQHLPLAPNTTPICQPVDIGIGGVIKAKIKTFFQNWIIDNWEYNESFMKKHPTKKDKYLFPIPTKELVIKWILQAYEEIDKKVIIESNILKQTDFIYFHRF